MENLSIGNLRRKIRKLERKIKGEKSAGWHYLAIFKQKITSPVAIGVGVVASAIIGWFSFKKIKKMRAAKSNVKSSKISKDATIQQSSEQHRFMPFLINAVTVVSTLSSALALFLGKKKSK